MSDSKSNFDPDFDASSATPADAELHSLLNARGQSMRDCSGMSERVTRATLPMIASGVNASGMNTSGKSFNFIAARERRIRWRVGFAVAASLVAAFVIVNCIISTLFFEFALSFHEAERAHGDVLPKACRRALQAKKRSA